MDTMHFYSGRIAGMVAAACMIISTFLAVLIFANVITGPYPTFGEENCPPHECQDGRLSYLYLEVRLSRLFASGLFPPLILLFSLFSSCSKCGPGAEPSFPCRRPSSFSWPWACCS